MTERNKTTKLHCLVSPNRRLGVMCKRPAGQNLLVMERSRFTTSLEPERCDRCIAAVAALSQA